ncbi:MAG: Zn-dependent oligopeptidase [Deltaproteobacteria bacterium]|nr:Zn-dependent oligopeptidase [Deltaproteobacteria bacterium]
MKLSFLFLERLNEKMTKHTDLGPIPQKFTRVLEEPAFEKSAEAVTKSIDELIVWSKKQTEEIGTQDLKNVTFASTLGALDDLHFEESKVLHRIHLLQNVSPDEALRKAAQEASNKYHNWAIEKAYDPKVYAAVKAYAAKNEKLEGEDKKALEETLRDYKRMGMDLPQESQNKLKELQKKLSLLETDFSTHINEFEDELLCTREELTGCAEDFINGLKKTEDGRFKVTLQYPDYLPVMEFCKSEEVRRALSIKKNNAARATNIDLLNQMISLRDEIASLLGYASWNDYVLEERMAKTPKRVQEFLSQFESKLKLKSKSELVALTDLKRSETKDPQAELKIWDYSFYSSLYKKKKYSVDNQELKEFFQTENVLKGMFDLVSKLFSVQFEEQKPGNFYQWHEDVRLFKVKDSQGDIGFFYLDLYPRQGKYGHAAAFTLTEGKYLPNGKFQRPVDAMVCNFPKSSPSLLPHAEVETLFHEFGHVMHTLLSQTKLAKFSGTNVAWDFVEAPSQVMENWVWDYDILQTFAKHAKDPSKKLSRDLVEKMNEAKKAGIGLFYLRQVSFAKSDLAFHAQGRTKDSTKIINDITAETFMPLPPDTASQASWGHMVGYASGYYGYAWADVIAADMFSLFRKQGLLNQDLGIKLREEIFEKGSSRDENISLEKFLGRPLDSSSFFEDLGLAS